MDLEELRTRIRAVILSLAGIVSAILIARIALDLISAPSSNAITEFIIGLSNIFISPFYGIIVLPASGILTVLNIHAIISLVAYIAGAFALSELITAFLYDSAEKVIENIVDAVFKFIEFFIAIRIVFELFGVPLNDSSSIFVRMVYFLSQWTQGLLFEIPFLTGNINVSAIVVLIIVVTIDALTERYAQNLFKQLGGVVTRGPKINLNSILQLIPRFNLRRYKDEKISETITKDNLPSITEALSNETKSKIQYEPLKLNDVNKDEHKKNITPLEG